MGPASSMMCGGTPRRRWRRSSTLWTEGSDIYLGVSVRIMTRKHQGGRNISSVFAWRFKAKCMVKKAQDACGEFYCVCVDCKRRIDERVAIETHVAGQILIVYVILMAAIKHVILLSPHSKITTPVAMKLAGSIHCIVSHLLLRPGSGYYKLTSLLT